MESEIGQINVSKNLSAVVQIEQRLHIRIKRCKKNQYRNNHMYLVQELKSMLTESLKIEDCSDSSL